MKPEIEAQIKEIKERLEHVQGTKCEVYSRIVGYHRPVEYWNIGKKAEFENRYTYKVKINSVR